MLEARDAVFAEPATMNRLASLKEEALVDNEETSFPTERAALLLTGLAFVWGGSGQAFADAPRGRNGKRTWAGSA
jgi:hypothetical protein